MHRDRLSELPLDLILHILSFLPIRDVVKTTLLSKQWVNLWTTVPCLAISDHEYELPRIKRFRKFVNRALRRWKGTKLQKFSLTINDLPFEDGAHAWIIFALKNKVQELEIRIEHDFLVPQDLYSCSSITRLSLCCDIAFRGSPSWNQLKCLTLIPHFCDCNIEVLVSQIMLSSPVLEELELEMGSCVSWENLNVMSTSLKWLKVTNNVSLVDTRLHKLSICCPNLETLEIRGLFKCLLTDVSSLTNAALGFYNGDRDCGENLRQIFSNIQNVEKLALTDWFVQVVGASRKKYLFSPLPNVKLLKLVVYNYFIEFGDVIDLLGVFPNLQYIKIEGVGYRTQVFDTVKYMEFETNISESLLQLKMVEINVLLFGSSVFGIIEFFFKHAVMLEKLVIWPNKGITFVEYKRFSEKLLSMPRSSPTARVILKSN